MQTTRSANSFVYRSVDNWLTISYGSPRTFAASLDVFYDKSSSAEAKNPEKLASLRSFVFRFSNVSCGYLSQTSFVVNPKSHEEAEVLVANHHGEARVTIQQTVLSNLINEVVRLASFCPGTEDGARSLLTDINALVYKFTLEPNNTVANVSNLINNITIRLAKDRMDFSLSPFRKGHVSENLKTKMAKYLEDQCAQSDVKTLPAAVVRSKLYSAYSLIDPREINSEDTITNYFGRLYKYWPLPDEACIAALFLMNRIRKEVPFNYFTIHRLLAGAWHAAANHFNVLSQFDDRHRIAGLTEPDFEQTTTEFRQHSLIQSCDLNLNEHFEMLAFLLDGEIHYGIRMVLIDYLVADVCSIISSYLTSTKLIAPSEDLNVSVSHFHLFPKLSEEQRACFSGKAPAETPTLERR